ncbi:MAG: hypothetical protein LW700_06680 [Gemmataceae bacterium]|nr:hypothetical protein [Gemmataceae bacterium]
MLCRLISQTIRTGFPTARKRLGRFNLEVKYPLMNGLFFGNCKGPALPSAGTDITLTCLFSALKTNRITYVLFNFFHVIIFGAPTKSLFQGLRRVFPRSPIQSFCLSGNQKNLLTESLLGKRLGRHHLPVPCPSMAGKLPGISGTERASANAHRASL